MKYNGNGRLLISGIAKEFNDGDTIEVPDKVGKKLLENRFFEEVKEIKKKTKILEVEE